MPFDEPVSLIVLLAVGLIAGWFAALVVRGGFGLIADIALGVVGAFLGTWLLNLAGVRIGGTVPAAIVNAMIGAAILLTATHLLKRREPDQL